LDAIAVLTFTALAKHLGTPDPTCTKAEQAVRLPGLHVCTNGAGAAAGGVYGVIHCFGRLLFDCVLGCSLETEGSMCPSLSKVRVGNPESTLGSAQDPQVMFPRRSFLDEFGSRLWPTSYAVHGDDPSLYHLGRARAPTVAEFQAARTARDAEELIKDRGSQVWFGRPVGSSSFVHLVIIVDGQKYELRMNHDDKKPYFNTAPATKLDIKELVVYLEHTPQIWDSEHNKLFSVYLIGWTNKSHEDIDAICREMIEGWKYHRYLFGLGKKSGDFRECLRLLAYQIIPRDRRALDWAWFERGEYSMTEREIEEEVV